MKDKKIIGTFALILVATSIMKLFGVSLAPLVDKYEELGTTIMQWVNPSLFTEIVPAGTETLVVYMPLLLFGSIILFTIHICVFRTRKDNKETH